MDILASTNGGGDGIWISVAAITAIGGVIIGIIKAFKAGVQKGKEAQDNNVTLKKPVPTIHTREEERFVSREEFTAGIGRMEDATEKIWEQFKTERLILNREIETMNQRWDSQLKATGELKGTVQEINKTVGQLLAIALRKTNSRQS